jgi:hypothetical protein
MPDYVGRAINGKIRIHAPDPWTLFVFMRERYDQDDLPCKCCSFECGNDLLISLSFCGMTLNATVPIPGILNQAQANLPDGSYLILSAQIDCGPCGWSVLIGVCAYCEATQQAASDSFTASIPFGENPEGNGRYCPETGAVDLVCFGEQFGIPCVTTPTASIA